MARHERLQPRRFTKASLPKMRHYDAQEKEISRFKKYGGLRIIDSSPNKSVRTTMVWTPDGTIYNVPPIKDSPLVAEAVKRLEELGWNNLSLARRITVLRKSPVARSHTQRKSHP